MKRGNSMLDRGPAWNRFQVALSFSLTLLACGGRPAAETKAPAAPRSPGTVLAPAPVTVDPPPKPQTIAVVAPDYAGLARELEAHLYRELVDRWFPRAVDQKLGGYGPHFKFDWSPAEKENRFLVFQSRMTWLAAQVALRSPERREVFRSYALHGLDWLEKKQWDAKHGGFFWDVSPSGVPVTTEKHVYGVAFGIYASAAVAQATGDANARTLALKAFEWLERHAHDAKNGGYYEALTREGTPILFRGTKTDQIGTIYGRKSMNAHIHLLEAFSALFEVAPEPRVRERLEEVFAIVRDKVSDQRGFLNLYFAPDWKPLPEKDSYGHDVETGYLLLEAARALGRPDDPETQRVARRLIDHARKWGWDREHGGFYDQGPIEGPASHTEKIWWTQAEGLNALLLMHELYGQETPAYLEEFRAQWAFIANHLVDSKHGEWFESASARGEIPKPEADKGGTWKDPYHQSRALMNSIDRLRRLARSP